VIRQAQREDIPELVGWGSRFHAISGMAAPFDAAAVAALLGQLIDAEAGVILTSGRGAIGGVLSPAYCAPAWVMAVEMFWWAEADGLRLLRAFEDWGRENGANEIRMTSLAAQPRAAEILARRGYAPAEVSHTKVI